MSKIDLNQSPYFDDYNESKKFYKILFRPGRPVQARELTQMQTALQQQVERMGRHLFEQGSQILPGSKEGVRYINNNGFIKIPRTANANSTQELTTWWLGKTIKNASNVQGKVIGFREADSINEARLYITYLQASVSGLLTGFAPGDTIETTETLPILATIPGTPTSVGTISSVIVEEGVYFFDGNFILVDQQTIFLTPEDTENQTLWNNQPTALAGLKVTESIVTSDDDETILDNALGSPNYAAPGADRLHISADLLQTTINDDSSDFVPLLRVIDGVVQARVIRTEYSVLEDTLARRTNDESGDYSVIPFQIQIKDFLRNETNNGVHNEREYHFNSQVEAETVSITTFGLADPGAAVLHPDFIAVWIPGTSYNTPGDATSFLQLCNDRLSIQIDPGKAYVKGYELEKLSTTIVDVPKARTLRYRNNKTIFTPLGTFLYVKNMFGALTFETYDTVELHADPIAVNGNSPGNRVGTARVLSIEFFSGVNGSAEGVYRLFLFNFQADPGKDLRFVKSLYSVNPSFTCDCVTQNYRLSGSVVAGVNTLTGTGTSWKNDETQRLQAGDYVQVSQGQNARIYKLLTNPANDNALNVSPDPTGAPWPAGSTIDYLYVLPDSNSRNNAGLVYQLPDRAIYTLRGGSQGFVDTSLAGIDSVYTSKRVIGSATVPVANQLQYTLTDPNEEFEDFSTSGYVVINRGNGDWLELVPYGAGSPSVGRCEVQALGAQVTFYLNGTDVTNSAGLGFYVITPIIHSGNFASKERSKTLVKGSFPLGVYSGSFAVSDGSDVSEVSLQQADILRITRVVESPDYAINPSDLEVLPAGHHDITGLYILDDGQRDNFYDIGKVVVRAGSGRPRGRVRIEFDYFQHGNTGNYFSVDSYPFQGPGKQMDYEEIPEFTSSDGTLYDLASAVDFRPRVNLGGPEAGFATILELPKENFRCDYHFYEGRIDKLFLDKTGLFLIQSGNPDVAPESPDEPETGMVIYELDFAPYTAIPASVFARFRDNKRYTMRDIGKLEKRIKNLEYYTTLSLLEANTNSLKITDAQGNDKFKNGYLVDNFSTFNGDLGSSDYRAAIDRTFNTARPIIFEENISLSEKLLLEPNLNQRNALRIASNYQKTGDLYTLPYAPVKMLEQKKASKVSNVNPFAVFTFVGAVEIHPWSDEWRDTSTAVPLNVVDSGAYDAMRSSFGPTGTNIDYTTVVNNWTGSVASEPTATGKQIIQIAGHEFYDKLPKKEQDRIKKQGSIVIPPGYANSGQAVPIGRRTFVAPELRTTTTLTGREITTNFTSTFVDQGFSTPVNLGSRIIDISAAEFIRSRDVEFSARAFMPFARLYPFFDNVDVSAECKIVGGAFGDPLLCDAKGRLLGTFKIPNTPGKRFKTGDRVFRLTTSPINQLNPPAASSGEGKYTARGWVDIQQTTTQSTRLFKTDRGSSPTDRDIALQSSEVFSAGSACPRDPIAQSFFVYDTGGCFITAVDIFFYKKPTGLSQPPITLQLRPLDDGGNPSIFVAPFGEVIKEAVEIITNRIDLNLGTLLVTGYDNSDAQIAANPDNSGPWPSTNITNSSGRAISSGNAVTNSGLPTDDMIPTRFTFASPVYCAQNQSYAFVLISDSDEYNVWVAQSGADVTGRDGVDSFRNSGDANTEIGTNTPILKDPYIQGIYFKSQNGISWSADQTIDLKYAIWKANFNTAVTGEIEFVNDELPLRRLSLDPVETKNGSTRVRISHSNHGLTTNAPASKVVFSPGYNVTLTGTLTTIAVTVTGTGTLFTSQLVVGSFIQHPITGEQKKVTAIASNTSLTIDSVFTSLQLSTSANVAATNFVVPSGAALNGLDASVLFNYAGHDVVLCEMDHYIIDLGTAATADGRVGGTSVVVAENKRFEELMLLTTPLTLPETSTTWNIQTTSSRGVNDNTNQAYVVLPRKNLTPNQKILFDRPMHVSSYINEQSNADTPSGPSQVSSNGLGDKKSLNVRAILKSTNRNLSPIIDTSRMSAYIVGNRLDSPRGVLAPNANASQVINDVFDNYQCLPSPVIAPIIASTANMFYFTTSTGALTGTASGTSGSITVTGVGTMFLSELRVGSKIKVTPSAEERTVRTITSDTLLTVDIAFGVTFGAIVLHTNPANVRIKTGDTNAARHISNLDIGKYLTLSGAVSSDRNFADSLVLSVDYTPGATVVDAQLGVPKLAEIEVDFRSLVAASIEVNSITFIQKDRFIDEIAPSGGSCSAKYVSKKLSVPRPSNALKVMFDAHRDISCTLDLYYKTEPVNSNKGIDDIIWIKVDFNLEINGVIQNAAPDANDNPNAYSSYESTLSELPAFVGAQIKIVMRGGNPAQPILLKNFVLIGLDE